MVFVCFFFNFSSWRNGYFAEFVKLSEGLGSGLEKSEPAVKRAKTFAVEDLAKYKLLFI